MKLQLAKAASSTAGVMPGCWVVSSGEVEAAFAAEFRSLGGLMGSTRVQFFECDPPASHAEVDAFERKLGFPVPAGIRELLTTANGGRPSPRIFGGRNGTDVSECLALRPGPGSISRTYDVIILAKRAAPAHFLPFAVDSGGNLFLVDCLAPDLSVHLLTHDPRFELHRLGVGLDGFWQRLSD